MLNIILIIIGIGILMAAFPNILAIGIILLVGYFIIANFSAIISFLIGILPTVLWILGILIVLGVIINIYEGTVGKRKRLSLRENVLKTVNKLGIADCKKISEILIVSEDKVLEELKVLVSLGEIDAQELNSGGRDGQYIYKAKQLGSNTIHTNFEQEEIVLD